jgi:hypothetical protein
MKNNFAEMMIEIETLLRSRRTIIYLVSHEENRVISALESMCSKADWDLIQWDIVSGIQSNFPEFLPLEKQRSKDQDEILDWFSNLIVPKNKFAILVLKDYQKHFGTHSVKTQLENKLIRHFKNLNHSLVKDNKSIIVLASSFELQL